MQDRHAPSASADAASPAWRPGAAGAAAAFAYPSVDPGFPALGLDHLLGAHADLLARIKICYGTDRDTFERDVLALVRRYAAFVHLLPATPANYFNVPGGLLRLGLETAFFALQGTDAHIFSGRATITTRRHLEPRWRLATFIAGLCAEMHRTLGRVIVTDHEGNEWQPYLLGLQPWLSQQGVARYYLKWMPNAAESPGISLFVLPHVVPAAMLQHLAQGNSVVVPHMMASLSAMPLYREHNILDELVRRSAALVIDRFLKASADRYGQPQLGSHLERYLVDALRRLVATHASWQPNAERSRVWYGRDGLFIVWPNGAADMRKLLEADQLPGIPKSPETMLEILLGAGVFEAQADGRPLWTITPPGAKAPLEAVRLAAAAVVLAGVEPRPEALADALAASPGPGKPDAVQPAVAAPGPRRAPSPTPTPTPTPTPEPEPAPDPAAPSEPHQMELPVSPASAGALSGPAPGPSATDAAPPPVPSLALRAPMRLAPRVRDALAEIVDALNAGSPGPLACVVEDGVFVALGEFEHRHVEPSLALRALSEARMLARGAGVATPTSTRAVGGQECLGLVIAAAFVAGLRPEADAPAREA
ncbi:Relaxase [Delftia sp. Cs1-4]|uniref:MobH family relaxase n=1 Tax=Delftia sp. (strain Cs1-4) TaxID=742013 RepID=UPI00020E7A7A|nr:MobH family relaxase [Delftia sp. Cs1-4]AEF88734.1 Relaxase [Delftia sp. Cs1-4]